MLTNGGCNKVTNNKWYCRYELSQICERCVSWPKYNFISSLLGIVAGIFSIYLTIGIFLAILLCCYGWLCSVVIMMAIVHAILECHNVILFSIDNFRPAHPIARPWGATYGVPCQSSRCDQSNTPVMLQYIQHNNPAVSIGIFPFRCGYIIQPWYITVIYLPSNL